jgi:hypothetical protein
MELYKEIISKNGVVSYEYLDFLNAGFISVCDQSGWLPVFLRFNEENLEGMPDKFLVIN